MPNLNFLPTGMGRSMLTSHGVIYVYKQSHSFESIHKVLSISFCQDVRETVLPKDEVQSIYRKFLSCCDGEIRKCVSVQTKKKSHLREGFHAR